jgi:hypothetical protein
LGSIVNTGLFYRDILQSRLPSYYDRTVNVLLNDKEGGINLDMPHATIQRIAYKGYLAGQAIAECFDFDHHRWVRFRLLLSQLEQQMIELRKPMMDDAPPVDRALLQDQLVAMRKFLQDNGITSNKVQELIDTQLKADRDPNTRFPLARSQEWVTHALPRLYALLLMIEVWGGSEKALFQLQSPELCAKDVNDDIDHILLRVTPEL